MIRNIINVRQNVYLYQSKQTTTMENLLKNLEWALKAAQDYGSDHIDNMTAHQLGMVYAYRYGVLKNAMENAISDINFHLEMSGKKPCKREE